LLFLLVTSQAFAQVDVTFKVDMNGQTVSADGVHVVGSINGWNTTATPLTQEGTTNIYSATIELSAGWYQYKFLNGNAWGTDEPKATYPCALTNGNRFVAIGEASLGNVVLATVPFGGCNEAGTSLEITFNVDMSSEGDIAQGSVHLTGWLNDWSYDNLSLPNKSGNIHSGTLRLPTPSDYPVTLQYKYLSAPGSWANQETPDANCASVTSTNRQVTFTDTNTSVGDVFNGCNYSLGLDDFNQIGLTSIYNKNTRSLSFISEGVIDSIAKIQIFDMSGKRVHNLTKINNLNTAKIDLNGTPNGLYFVQAEINGSDYVKKVLVY
ncbi:MAG: T9SS type A sorting domain-containing protein, partial [Bacteroidetes bacterium]|nr:T9SS type A sorting domain-containing protein [Bacteroidota bacterium]